MTAPGPIGTLTHTDTRVQYRVCESCGPAIVNDDWSHMHDALAHANDKYEWEDTRSELDGCHAWLELVGFLSLVGPYDGGGYWDCECCGQVTIGDGWALEGDRKLG